MRVRDNVRAMAQGRTARRGLRASRKRRRRQAPWLRAPALLGIGIVAGIALAITLYGGYGSPDWTWTGYHGKELWDWLHALLLPVAFGLVAILVRAEELGQWRAVIGLTAFSLFVALVVAGYAIPWDWTGFVGNTVWDWLGLVLLPLTLSILAGYQFDVRSVQGHHLILISVFVGAITVMAIGGYTQGWDWTASRATRCSTGWSCSSCPS